MNSRPRHLFKRTLAAWLAAWMAFAPFGTAGAAMTVIADGPIFATQHVPPNLLLDLSVEWPTGSAAAYRDVADATPGYQCPGRVGGMGICYFDSRTYFGLFDPLKCYAYNGAGQYFVPAASAAGANGHSCLGLQQLERRLHPRARR